MPKKIVPQSPQKPLFNPDLEPIRYIASNGTFEFTLDGKFQTFWLSQKQIAELFNLAQNTISHHVKTFKEARPSDAESAYRNFGYTAADGKTYDVEHYNHNVVIYIGYRAQATEETIRFQRFVEEVFRQRMEQEHARAMHKAVHKRNQDITAYVLGGFTPSHAAKRVDSKETVKHLNAQVVRLTDPKFIGQVLSKEYVTLFGKLASELKQILHNESIRDALPELQMGYVELAEKTLVMVLSQHERMTSDELLATVIKTIKPLAEHLKMICEVMNIDIVTGAKLLEAGK